MSYSKLHSSVVNSSLWTQPDHVRILFVTLLALADKEGYVFGSRTRLLQIANVAPGGTGDSPVDPWEVLLGPDPDSSDLQRCPENEGRRIEQVEGGFRLLNFEYYRALRHDEDRREQNRAAQARYRETHKPQSARSKRESAKRNQAVSTISQSQPISEAEAEAEAEKNKTNTTSAELRSSSPAVFLVFPLQKGEWQLTVYQVHAWEEAFEELDVQAELRKAHAWIEANPSKRKTYKGMPKFLVAWLNRASGRAEQAIPARPTAAAIDPQAAYAFTCSHVPRCAGRWECARKDQIAAVKAAAR